MEEFKNLDSDIEGSAKRWKKFVESEVPEKEVFPKEWKNKSALQKLCMLRCMRPDRMTYAIRCTGALPGQAARRSPRQLRQVTAFVPNSHYGFIFL